MISSADMEAYLHRFLQKFQHLAIPLEEIKKATNDFNDNPIGIGGFGKVYKGIVSHAEGRSMVAIKRLNRDPNKGLGGQGTPEFLKEIVMLSEYKHANIISLLGYCCEGGEMILVYEHASRGSLDRYLKSPDLTWRHRLKICLDSAKGLSYLHDPRKTHRRLIHCDVKSSNILLDEQWNAKVSDFGLSTMGSANDRHSVIVTPAAGTMGYIDPLYWMTHTLTKESDVYSLGVVFFEVLCGTLCYTHSAGHANKSLVPMWIDYYEQNKLNDIIFKDLNIEPMHHFVSKRFSRIAYQCLKQYREDRPKMADVATELESALNIHEFLQNEEFVGKWNEQLYEYQEMIKTARPPLNYGSEDELMDLLFKGVLLNNGKKVEHVDDKQTSDSDSDASWEEKLPADYEDIMKRSKISMQWTTKEEAYSIIRQGFLIRDDENKSGIWFSLDINGKKCHMLSANAADICGYHKEIMLLPESRFGEAIQCDSNTITIKTEVQSQLVSSETTYAIYLVYKLPKDQSGFDAPMHVTDGKGVFITWHIYLASPQTPVIRPKANQNTHNPSNKFITKGVPLSVPHQRNDGWMEVQVGEFKTKSKIDIKLSSMSVEKNYSKIIIEGIEFRRI